MIELVSEGLLWIAGFLTTDEREALSRSGTRSEPDEQDGEPEEASSDQAEEESR